MIFLLILSLEFLIFADNEHLEIKLKEYHAISEQIKALEAKKKELSQEILNTLPQNIKNYQTPRFKVFKQQRTSFKTTVEEAVLLQAVKTELVVDKEKLKNMLKQGVSIPGVSHTEFVRVIEIREPDLQPSLVEEESP